MERMSRTPTPPEGHAPRGASRPGRGPRAVRRGPMLPGRGPFAGVPPVAAFLLVLVVFVVAVVLGGGLGALLLGLLALAVVALLAATWPRLSTAERAGRGLVLAVLVAVALAQVLR